MMSFRDKLVFQRKKAGFSQTELGSKIGSTKAVISNWERGLSKPSYEDVARLCNLFSVPSDYFNAEKEVLDVEENFCRMVRGYLADPKLTREDLENLFRNFNEIFLECTRNK